MKGIYSFEILSAYLRLIYTPGVSLGNFILRPMFDNTGTAIYCSNKLLKTVDNCNSFICDNRLAIGRCFDQFKSDDVLAAFNYLSELSKACCKLSV